MTDFYTMIPALPAAVFPSPSSLPPSIVQQGPGFSPTTPPPSQISLQVNPAAEQSQSNDMTQMTHEYVNVSSTPPQITGPLG